MTSGGNSFSDFPKNQLSIFCSLISINEIGKPPIEGRKIQTGLWS